MKAARCFGLVVVLTLLMTLSQTMVSDSDIGLAAGTTCTVNAYDAVGNERGQSEGVLGFGESVEAADIYVDNTFSSDCTSGNYSTTNRNCSGSNGDAYTTVQAAINAMNPGDHIYLNSADLIIGDTPGETFTIETGDTYYHNGNIIIMGDGVLMVNGALHLTGHLYVTDTGSFTVDGGEFHLKGNDTHIYVYEDGTMLFRNSALLHYVMTYMHQHYLICANNAHIELRNSLVDRDGSTGTIRMHDNASYKAVNTIDMDWKTWYLYGQNSLTLENVTRGGDIAFYENPTMRFVNTVGVMPWLYFGEGTVVDYSFPDENPVTITIDNSTPGISGIPWTLIMEDCYSVAWGINPYPESDVTIRDSQLRMLLFRFIGEGQMELNGIMRNGSYYDDLTVPVSDRTLRLMNTSVEWWKVDIVEGFQLNADSIIFSEMCVKDNSIGYINNSICEGQTIHLGATDDAFISFDNGEVWTFVSVWTNATMVLRDSLVDYSKGQYTYQTRNIAHNNSRLYCLNTTFGYEEDPSESEPEAMDSALAMYLKLDGPDTAQINQSVDILGSAWITQGPSSPVTFDQYQLSIAPEGSSDWTIIQESTISVRDGVLGKWDTTGLTGGSYRVRLELWVNNDSTTYPTYQYPAETVIVIAEPLVLHGTPADQAIRLSWTVETALPATSTWQIAYDGPTGDQPSPISGIVSPTRAYTLTGLTNYTWYTVTLNAMSGSTAFLTDTVHVMPTDRFVYLPLVLK